MVEIETDQSDKQPQTQQPSNEVQHSPAELELLERVDRQSRAVTAAEHKAIYGSMARDYKGWLALQAVQQPAD